jgi:hypothetical protein
VSEIKKDENGLIETPVPKGLKSRSGSPYLDRVREAIIRSYTAEYVEKKIGELCEAEDLKVGKDGEEHKTPNWRAREGGLKMILQIQGIEDLSEEKVQRAAPTNIIVNIVNTDPKTVVEVKSETIKDDENEIG